MRSSPPHPPREKKALQKRPRPPATRGELRVPHARHACHRGTTLIARDDEGAGARRVLAEGVAAFSITRDGRHVIFHPSGASDQRPVFSVPVDGGAPVWVADNVGDVVTAGPAGERIAIGAPGPVCDLGADLGPGSGLDSGCGPLSAVRLEGPRRGEAIALADEAQLLA